MVYWSKYPATHLYQKSSSVNFSVRTRILFLAFWVEWIWNIDIYTGISWSESLRYEQTQATIMIAFTEKFTHLSEIARRYALAVALCSVLRRVKSWSVKICAFVFQYLVVWSSYRAIFVNITYETRKSRPPDALRVVFILLPNLTRHPCGPKYVFMYIGIIIDW